jgi:hypothetical protein
MWKNGDILSFKFLWFFIASETSWTRSRIFSDSHGLLKQKKLLVFIDYNINVFNFFLPPITGTCWYAGLWIRIDLIRIRIQHFCSIRIRIQNRIRIQAKTELSKTISFSNFFEIKIWVKSNQKYWCYSQRWALPLQVAVIRYSLLSE